MTNLYLNPAQLKAEYEKCLQCPTKPCLAACPVSCSPHDFIAAARQKNWQQAAELILQQNPLGETCGLVCPEKFCMRACLRAKIDYPIRIPAVQASLLQKARGDGYCTAIQAEPNGKTVAVVGLGPAGIGAVAELLRGGFAVTAFEAKSAVGGALNLIPSRRLPREVVNYEWQRLCQSERLQVQLNTVCDDYETMAERFDAVVVCVGEKQKRTLGVEGENYAVSYGDYLQNPDNYITKGNVAIIGGGAAAVDCAVTAVLNGAANVEMFVRRRMSDMRITAAERALLLQNNVNISSLTRITAVSKDKSLINLHTCKTQFAADGKLVDVPDSSLLRRGFSLTIMALGSTNGVALLQRPNIFYAGDVIIGSSTAVQAIASGKFAAQKVKEYCGF